MADDLIHIDRNQYTGKNLVWSLLINAVINTLIAGLLTAIGFGRGFIVNLIFSQCIGMSIYGSSLLIIPVVRRTHRSAYQLALMSLTVVFGATVGTVLGALANGISITIFIKEYSAYFLQIILIGLVFGAIISYVFLSLGRISDEKVKRLEAEKNAADTEIKLLQSQMEPHFLFNTLSNILSLIQTDPDRASRMLESFTSFLRSSLLTARQKTVTLSQEIDIVKNYLAVFAVRMGYRLRYTIDVPDSLRDFPIPPLLVQPLVENAIKHGLEPVPEGGTIAIQASQEGVVVRISVVDSGTGISENAAGAGIGLENIRKRLELVYGDRARLIFEENPPRGIRVVVEVPYDLSMSNDLKVK